MFKSMKAIFRHFILQNCLGLLVLPFAGFSSIKMASNLFSDETYEEKMEREEENEKQIIILTQLPEEIIEKILTSLSYNDLAEIRGVSLLINFLLVIDILPTADQHIVNLMSLYDRLIVCVYSLIKLTEIYLRKFLVVD